MCKEKLLIIIQQIQNEIENLSEYGDIPNDSYRELTNWLEEATALTTK